MRYQTRPSLVQIMACRLLGAKPLSGTMLDYCELDFRTYFSEILIKIQNFSLNNVHLKMSSAKFRPSYLGLNVLSCFINQRQNWLPLYWLFSMHDTRQFPHRNLLLLSRWYGVAFLNENNIDGLVQEWRNSSALAMGLRLSCTNPSIFTGKCLHVCCVLFSKKVQIIVVYFWV